MLCAGDRRVEAVGRAVHGLTCRAFRRLVEHVLHRGGTAMRTGGPAVGALCLEDWVLLVATS